MVLIGIQLAKVVKKETLSNVEVEPVLLIQKTE
jgi:hypothetical protein